VNDEALLAEHPESLTQGVARHPQVAAQRLLGQPQTRREQPLDDLFPEHGRNPVGSPGLVLR